VFEVWSGKVGADELTDWFHSSRFNTGPTADQIRAGDDRAFAYGVGAAVGPRTRPLFWDRQQWSQSNTRLVAFANGAVKQVSEDDFATLDLGVPSR